jgi:rare lipoprotein A
MNANVIIGSAVRPRVITRLCAALLVGLAMTMLFEVRAVEARVKARPAANVTQVGKASWYGPRFHGRKTANGEIFDQHAMTAAHRRLPLGTIVAVTSLDTGRTVKVRINDRGPYVRGRIIDLSRAAARKLGLIGQGVGRVKVKVLAVPSRPA